MNYKLIIGRSFTKVDNFLKRRHNSLVNKLYPWGRDFVFDLKRMFPSNEIATIVDAGANVGSVSLDFSFYFPSARIFSFEPVSATFERLRLNTKKNTNITPVKLALGESRYQVEIVLDTEDTINSLASQPAKENVAGTETILVEALDTYVNEHKVERVDILKIDVEGFEFNVLEGANQLVRESIKAIVLEVGYERAKSKVHFSDVEVYMEKMGFQCCGVYDLSKSRDKRRLYYSNNLYIRKDLI